MESFGSVPSRFRIRGLESFASARVSPIVSNSYVSLVLQVLLVLYTMKFAPKLPLSVMKFLNNPLMVVAALFLIVYTSTKNATTALLLAVAVVVTMHTINKYKNMSSLLSSLSGGVGDMEGFNSDGGMSMNGSLSEVVGEVVGNTEGTFYEGGQPQQVNSYDKPSCGMYGVSDSGIISNQYYCDNHTFDKAYNTGCGNNWGKAFDSSYGNSDEYSDAVGSENADLPPYHGYVANTPEHANKACCSNEL